MKTDPNSLYKANFTMDSPTIVINMSDPHHSYHNHHGHYDYPYFYRTTTVTTTTTTEKTFDCTTPIQVSGTNNVVRVTSTIANTDDGDSIAVVTCTVIDPKANNQAWMNENGYGWFTSPDGQQTMIRTYKCNHETGSWYIGNTPTDAVRFVRCSDKDQ
ncbi:Hypothetical protein SRAE_0000037500 [Strongyloides ratti]|uniref:C6 domain-containing protein n=1 Tax=Strongyloides ratti TaxID=34506 RepID=A0A090L1C3_STRRB|nr:Hypothetical protein SRAE_0000037500 [Strongyloides ratti]CEF61249.1 Hypothetical protein SRAE_0000037500 [Strongyloides ratti]